MCFLRVFAYSCYQNCLGHIQNQSRQPAARAAGYVCMCGTFWSLARRCYKYPLNCANMHGNTHKHAHTCLGHYVDVRHNLWQETKSLVKCKSSRTTAFTAVATHFQFQPDPFFWPPSTHFNLHKLSHKISTIIYYVRRQAAQWDGANSQEKASFALKECQEKGLSANKAG